MAASLVVAAGAASAFASDSYTIPLHQQVPLTAAGFGSTKPTCADIPTSQDGWHFIAPGNPNQIAFVKLTVTFEPGGPKEITTFDAPNENHAYVASEPGAKLVSAVAEVTGGSLEWFNLSHTCPASTLPSSTPPKTPSATPSSTPSSTTSGTPSGTVSSPAVSSPPASVPASPGTTTGAPSTTASSPAPVTGGATTGGDLAKTGSDLPVGLLAALAGALIAAGGVLVVRRRKAL
ncbi:LPXTG cell wall anchor domain-containing protein [Streptomyces sp. ISL-43]|uniref:LPXTG cell wall anchor domain-containing protein n=1 Tax=Streptomyces sp. ISL-43 TaxID=2819183 RepID=UPI001BE9A235|nr:LPXTG cell wall anchor domain-containing protein [Streptomyces sp. ISL-43]MBT2449652.1 LPXTG cell wall anchor domain-containing protein [Streptomyces sp. ISL-43]